METGSRGSTIRTGTRRRPDPPAPQPRGQVGSARYDVLARYGGEEFIAMLPDATASQALLLGERLRKMIEQRPFLTEDGETIKVTVSVGVAQAKAPYEKKDLISQADQALYRAKESGRNRIVIYAPANFEAEKKPAPRKPIFKSLKSW